MLTRWSKVFWFALMPALLLGVLAYAADDSAASKDTAVIADSTQTATPSTQTFVTYFHGDQRCPTCLKLEAYSREAIESGFADSLATGCLHWRMVNYDQEDNKHYVDDYQLYTKALVLSRVVDGKEVAWKNLDKIWTLVGDKAQFIEYVQKETRAFLAGTPGE